MGNPNWEPRDYASFDDVRAELDRFDRAHAAGTLRTTGGWSAGQILEHCSVPIKGSMDGAEGVRIPWYLRLAGRLVFKPMLGRSTMKPGIKLPKSASKWLPDESLTFEQGMSSMRGVLDRLGAGERMTEDSPLMGKMTHEQWTILNLDHCRLHFGFIRCD